MNATLPRLNACLLTALLLALLSVGTKAEENLIAYWPLTVDGRDVSGNGHDATAHGMTFDAKDGALFDGRGAYLEVAHTDAINVGEGDFAKLLADDLLSQGMSWVQFIRPEEDWRKLKMPAAD